MKEHCKYYGWQLINAFIQPFNHLLVTQIFIDHLLCAKHHAICWGKIIMSQEKHGPFFSGDYSPESRERQKYKTVTSAVKERYLVL